MALNEWEIAPAFFLGRKRKVQCATEPIVNITHGRKRKKYTSIREYQATTQIAQIDTTTTVINMGKWKYSYLEKTI